jgi:hypothetical protein
MTEWWDREFLDWLNERPDVIRRFLPDWYPGVVLFDFDLEYDPSTGHLDIHFFGRV